MRQILTLALLTLICACTFAGPPTAAPFQDTFDDNHNQWTLTQSRQAEIAIAGGQLRIAVSRPESLAWTRASGKIFYNFTLDVDATPLSGPDDNDYGVLVRRVDDDNFYRFEISSDGFFNVQKRRQGQWEKLVADWAESPAIRKGRATNHLRVVCAGRALTFSVNGTQLAQVTDDALARGEIGLLAGTLSAGGVQIAFDNLRVNPQGSLSP
jgi:hypothetical protein